MRARCSKCKKSFFVTEYKSKCQRCVLYSPSILNTKFKRIVHHRSLRDFKEYMDRWYGASA